MVMVEAVFSIFSLSTTGCLLGGRTGEESKRDRYWFYFKTIVLNSPSLIGSTVKVVLDRCSEVAVMDMV